MNNTHDAKGSVFDDVNVYTESISDDAFSSSQIQYMYSLPLVEVQSSLSVLFGLTVIEMHFHCHIHHSYHLLAYFTMNILFKWFQLMPNDVFLCWSWGCQWCTMCIYIVMSFILSMSSSSNYVICTLTSYVSSASLMKPNLTKH